MEYMSLANRRIDQRNGRALSRRTMGGGKKRKQGGELDLTSPTAWKAFQMKPEFPYKAAGFASGNKGTIQMTRFRFGPYGFDTENLAALANWVETMNTVNPDRVVEFCNFIESDAAKLTEEDKRKIWACVAIKVKDIPFSRTDTRPLQDTIYGLDINFGQEAINNVKLAYRAGFRDFDAAVRYQGGKTADLLSWLITREPGRDNPVRIIYKFKVEEFQLALADLENLVKIPNVRIHTVMLHEVPPDKKDIVRGFGMLKFLADRFEARVGLSNVHEFEGLSQCKGVEKIKEMEKIRETNRIGVSDVKTLLDLDMGSRFTDLYSLGMVLWMQLSSVENKMGPGAPDELVRQKVREKGIDYLGYGLKGSINRNTCDMGENEGDEHFSIMDDPLFQQKIKELKMDKGDVARGSIYRWGRMKGIKTLATSTSFGTMQVLRNHFRVLPDSFKKFCDFLGIYKHGNKKLVNYAEPQWDKVHFYKPFRMFLEREGKWDVFQKLRPLVPDSFWRFYYKHAFNSGLDICVALDNLERLEAKGGLYRMNTYQWLLEYRKDKYGKDMPSVTHLRNLIGMCADQRWKDLLSDHLETKKKKKEREEAAKKNFEKISKEGLKEFEAVCGLQGRVLCDELFMDVSWGVAVEFFVSDGQRFVAWYYYDGRERVWVQGNLEERLARDKVEEMKES